MERTRKLFLFAALMFFLMVAGFANATPPALQTQYGSDGIEVDLIRCKVVGNVLTAVFSFRTSERRVHKHLHVEQVYYIANNKKYQVLKDEKGAWLAAPKINNLGGGPAAMLTIEKDKPKIAWYKFPAPPESVAKIQLNLDDITPFDEVEIQR